MVELLFGVQQGLDVQVIDGTDAIYEVKDGDVTLDMAANFPDRIKPDDEYFKEQQSGDDRRAL